MTFSVLRMVFTFNKIIIPNVIYTSFWNCQPNVEINTDHILFPSPLPHSNHLLIPLTWAATFSKNTIIIL